MVQKLHQMAEAGIRPFFWSHTREKWAYSDGHAYTWAAQKRTLTLFNALAVIHARLALVDTVAFKEERNS